MLAGTAKGTADWAAQLGSVSVTHIQGERCSAESHNLNREFGRREMKFVPLLSFRGGKKNKKQKRCSFVFSYLVQFHETVRVSNFDAQVKKYAFKTQQIRCRIQE